MQAHSPHRAIAATYLLVACAALHAMALITGDLGLLPTATGVAAIVVLLGAFVLVLAHRLRSSMVIPMIGVLAAAAVTQAVLVPRLSAIVAVLSLLAAAYVLWTVVRPRLTYVPPPIAWQPPT